MNQTVVFLSCELCSGSFHQSVKWSWIHLHQKHRCWHHHHHHPPVADFWNHGKFFVFSTFLEFLFRGDQVGTELIFMNFILSVYLRAGCHFCAAAVYSQAAALRCSSRGLHLHRTTLLGLQISTGCALGHNVD